MSLYLFRVQPRKARHQHFTFDQHQTTHTSWPFHFILTLLRAFEAPQVKEM